MGKVVGIIGGMGPLATVKLFEKIVALTKASKDQEHLHILIDNNTLIPDRTDYILDNNFQDPRPMLIESAKGLEKSGADFLIMPCNTAHKFYDDILKNINIPFLNMIEETAQYIIKNNPDTNKIGLLATDGTIKAEVYDYVFKQFGIDIITPSKGNQKYVYELIYNIKMDKEYEKLHKFYNTMEEMKKEGIDVFVTGCTELSVALELYKLKGDFIDPLNIIAMNAIEFAGGRLKTLE